MSSKFNTYQKRRLTSSYFSVVISISLVLFMIGVLGLVLLKSTNVANHFKEKVAINLFLKDEVSKKQIDKFCASLREETFTKRIVYVSKKQAARDYSREIGEDFLTFLGKNPLKNGIDIYLKADFVSSDKMLDLEKKFNRNLYVAAVSYDKPLIELLTKNIQRISFWLFILCGFFALIAILLINSSIRLTIYSKRFNIKTMQMVGATKSFIRKPFLWRSIRLSMIGAFISLLGLAVIIYYLDKYIPVLELLKDYKTLLFLMSAVVISAIVITSLSTFFATQRFLNLRTDELYY